MGCYEQYTEAYRRITELVSDENAGTLVAACPGWSVKDVVAHLSGGLHDFLTHRMDLAGEAGWGERQVRERRDWPLQHSLAEWRDNLGRAEELLNSSAGPLLVADVILHEHDIRAALGHAGARQEEAIETALDPFLIQLAHKIRQEGLPALRILTDGDQHLLGEGPAPTTLRTSSFELLRALSGRRTAEQVALLDWSGDPTSYLEVFFTFGPAERAIFE